MTLRLIDEATAAGALFDKACKVLELGVRTVARWRAEGSGVDRRALVDVMPTHALNDEERAPIVLHATSPEYRNLSPKRIVPLLADKGGFIASESNFYRVLRAHGMLTHRQPTRPAARRRPDEHVATEPNRVWAWDITYLRSPVRGVFYYLYLVLDVFSRKSVAAEVHVQELADTAPDVVTAACARERVARDTLVVHSDDGRPTKGATMLATPQQLGAVASFRRPSVSDENAYAESLFRTLKCRPGYPKSPFATLADAQSWVDGFVDWYNHRHLARRHPLRYAR